MPSTMHGIDEIKKPASMPTSPRVSVMPLVGMRKISPKVTRRVLGWPGKRLNTACVHSGLPVQILQRKAFMFVCLCCLFSFPFFAMCTVDSFNQDACSMGYSICLDSIVAIQLLGPMEIPRKTPNCSDSEMLLSRS